MSLAGAQACLELVAYRCCTECLHPHHRQLAEPYAVAQLAADICGTCRGAVAAGFGGNDGAKCCQGLVEDLQG